MLYTEYTEGVSPEKFKLAEVTPILKNGYPTAEVSNYKPISVLSYFSQILDKVLYKGTIKFLDKYNLISDYRYGCDLSIQPQWH